MLTCISTLSPNQYGIKQNYLNGAISQWHWRGGIHMIGPFSRIIPFPATMLTMEFSSHVEADQKAVVTRTGADPKDPDSGGQPIVIGCALQFRFIPEHLRDIFLAFGGYDGARLRYLLLAGNMVSNTAQQFTPQSFWQNRQLVSERMRLQINETLYHNGWGECVTFEIMKVDFADKFEDAITAVQVAEQQKVVNEYEQTVARVVQEIEVLNAENNAHIANISSAAVAMSRERCAGATRDVFNQKQAMKATKYAELKTELGLSHRQMGEYFKIKALQNQVQNGKVTVGVPTVGQQPRSSPASSSAARSSGAKAVHAV